MYVETEVSTHARHEHDRRLDEIRISSYMRGRLLKDFSFFTEQNLSPSFCGYSKPK
jgi:hypothetical protein